MSPYSEPRIFLCAGRLAPSPRATACRCRREFVGIELHRFVDTMRIDHVLGIRLSENERLSDHALKDLISGEGGSHGFG